jgi:hypothetical protein
MNKKKKITLMGNYAIMDVSTKKYSNKCCLIDLEDIEKVSKINWSPNNNGYAHGGSYKRFLLHRYIMNAQKGQIIDHINGDIMDNRKANLRFVTHQQNHWNNKKEKTTITSKTGTKYVGVQLSPIALKCKLKKPYVARMTINKRTIYLGYFRTQEEASQVYLKKAIEVKGEYIREVPSMMVSK